MLDLWLEQESQIEKTAAQQFAEYAEKIAVEGSTPGAGLEAVKPSGEQWETSNYSEEVKTPEEADRLLQRELTGRVVDEVPKTNVQQTPPRTINTDKGRATDPVPTVDQIKTAGFRNAYTAGRAWGTKGKLKMHLKGNNPGEEGSFLVDFAKKKDVDKFREAAPKIWDKKVDRAGLHLGKHRNKYIAGAGVGAAGAGALAVHKLRKNKEKKASSIKETMMKVAAEGLVRTMEDWK